MRVIVFWLAFLAAGLVFFLIWNLQKQKNRQWNIWNTYQEITGFSQKSSETKNWYQKKERWLKKHGAAFHYGRKIQPISYLEIQLALGAAGMFCFLAISPVAGLAAAIILFFMPDILLLYLDKKDNEQLLPEIKLVYHALQIQIQAGVYLAEALTECYGSVDNVRLRSALLGLAGDIALHADLYQALENFQDCFDNRYIDSLCIILLQALESGQVVELLGDIGEQIKDMEQSVLEKKKNALDRKVTFYQLGILAAVLGIALYACMRHMLGAAGSF